MDSDSNEIWNDDRLGRKAQSKDIVNYLVNRSNGRRDAGLARGFVLAIDSDYGQGKSYFVQNTMADVTAHHPACLIDAWTDDRINSPFLAILDGIERALEPFFAKDKKLKDTTSKLISGSGKLMKGLAVGAGRQLAIKAAGEGVDHLIDEALEDDIDLGDAPDVIEEAIDEGIKRVESLEDSSSKKGLKEYRQQKKSMSRLRNRLKLLAEHIASGNAKSLPIFVFIDELDRCRPDYAISLLEEIKHLFDVPGFVFVLSMQKKQLLESISAIYGDGFDSNSYLDRFIDKLYVLDAPSCTDFVQLELAKEPFAANAFLVEPFGMEVERRVALVFDQAGLTLREAERAIDTLRASVSLLGTTKVDVMYLAHRIVHHMKLSQRKSRHPFSSIDLEWKDHSNHYQVVTKHDKIKSFPDLINQISQCAGWDQKTVEEQLTNVNRADLYYAYQLMKSFYGQFEYKQPKNVTMMKVCDDVLVKAKPFQANI